MWEILTKIPLKSLEWQTYSQNYKNIPKTTKLPKKKEKKKKKTMNHLLDQNSPKISKITPKPLK